MIWNLNSHTTLCLNPAVLLDKSNTYYVTAMRVLTPKPMSIPSGIERRRRRNSPQQCAPARQAGMTPPPASQYAP